MTERAPQQPPQLPEQVPPPLPENFRRPLTERIQDVADNLSDVGESLNLEKARKRRGLMFLLKQKINWVKDVFNYADLGIDEKLAEDVFELQDDLISKKKGEIRQVDRKMNRANKINGAQRALAQQRLAVIDRQIEQARDTGDSALENSLRNARENAVRSFSGDVDVLGDTRNILVLELRRFSESKIKWFEQFIANIETRIEDIRKEDNYHENVENRRTIMNGVIELSELIGRAQTDIIDLKRALPLTRDRDGAREIKDKIRELTDVVRENSGTLAEYEKINKRLSHFIDITQGRVKKFEEIRIAYGERRDKHKAKNIGGDITLSEFTPLVDTSHSRMGANVDAGQRLVPPPAPTRRPSATPPPFPPRTGGATPPPLPGQRHTGTPPPLPETPPNNLESSEDKENTKRRRNKIGKINTLYTQLDKSNGVSISPEGHRADQEKVLLIKNNVGSIENYFSKNKKNEDFDEKEHELFELIWKLAKKIKEEMEPIEGGDKITEIIIKPNTGIKIFALLTSLEKATKLPSKREGGSKKVEGVETTVVTTENKPEEDVFKQKKERRRRKTQAIVDDFDSLNYEFQHWNPAVLIGKLKAVEAKLNEVVNDLDMDPYERDFFNETLIKVMSVLKSIEPNTPIDEKTKRKTKELYDFAIGGFDHFRNKSADQESESKPVEGGSTEERRGETGEKRNEIRKNKTKEVVEDFNELNRQTKKWLPFNFKAQLEKVRNTLSKLEKDEDMTDEEKDFFGQSLKKVMEILKLLGPNIPSKIGDDIKTKTTEDLLPFVNEGFDHFRKSVDQEPESEPKPQPKKRDTPKAERIKNNQSEIQPPEVHNEGGGGATVETKTKEGLSPDIEKTNIELGKSLAELKLEISNKNFESPDGNFDNIPVIKLMNKIALETLKDFGKMTSVSKDLMDKVAELRRFKGLKKGFESIIKEIRTRKEDQKKITEQDAEKIMKLIESYTPKEEK